MCLIDPRRTSENPSRRVSLKGHLGRIAALALAVSVSAVPVCLVRGQSTPPASPASGANKPTQQPAVRPGETAPPTSKDQIKVLVKVVDVPVTVVGKHGLPIIDLTQSDFQIYEDGRPQSIRYFSQESHLPLRIGLILDTSNSARRQLEFEKNAATDFVFQMLQGRNVKNQIFLETFDTSSSLVQDFTTDPEALSEKIQDLKAGGGKALYDAIYNSCKDKMMHAGDPERTRRVLVLISDGLDVQSQHSLDEAISMAHKAETMIYTIGNASYGFTNAGDDVLAGFADGTGGGAFFPLRDAPGTDLATGYLSHGQIGETSQNKGLGAETGTFSAQRLVHIADAMEAIYHELGAQYDLGYTPTNELLDGTYRSIRVLLTRKGVTCRWKPGYFATPE